MKLHFEFENYYFIVEDDYMIPKRSNVYNVEVISEAKTLFKKNFRIKKDKISLLTCDDIISSFERHLIREEKRKLTRNQYPNDRTIIVMKNICRTNKLKKILN